MFAKQFYWSKLSQAFFKLGLSRAFQLSPDRFPFSYWVHIDWLALGGLIGVGNLTIWGKPKLRSRLPVMVLALAASHSPLSCCFCRGIFLFIRGYHLILLPQYHNLNGV